MYENNSVGPDTEKCNAKVIRQLLKKSDFLYMNNQYYRMLKDKF